MSKSNDKLRQIVTDALVGMISGVTGLVPPTGPGSIPDFVQAPIDRAVEKISSRLKVDVPGYLRQAIGEAASEWLHENDPDGIDWCDSRNIDGLLDAILAAAATVKAEQPCPACDGAGELHHPHAADEYRCESCDGTGSVEEVSSMPAAGSALVSDALEKARRHLSNAIEDAEDGKTVAALPALREAAHFLTQAVISGQQAGPRGVPDTARLDFMLANWRKVVCELLPHDNFEVYVEEGFMGDKRYPAVRYSGEWEQGSPEALEIQREAIDAAITSQGKQSGGEL